MTLLSFMILIICIFSFLYLVNNFVNLWIYKICFHPRNHYSPYHQNFSYFKNKLSQCIYWNDSLLMRYTILQIPLCPRAGSIHQRWILNSHFKIYSRLKLHQTEEASQINNLKALSKVVRTHYFETILHEVSSLTCWHTKS